MRLSTSAVRLTLIAATLAGCSGGGTPAGEAKDAPTETAAALPTDRAPPTPAPTASSTSAAFTGTLPGPADKDPQAIVAYWKGAVEAGDYAAADKAWRTGVVPAMTPKGSGPASVTFGTGDTEGGAGSLYFTAPVTVTVNGPDGEPISTSGTFTARRVNDVDGATAEQLSWRIVAIEWK